MLLALAKCAAVVWILTAFVAGQNSAKYTVVQRLSLTEKTDGVDGEVQLFLDARIADCVIRQMWDVGSSDFSRSVPLAGAMLVLVGAAMMAVFAMVNSLVQLITTNEMRGRVMSLYNFAFRGGMPMGNLLSGWLVPLTSAPTVLGVNGVLLIGVAVYFMTAQRRVATL